jgi:PIN domain nuclease of toxin-antitoxin system
MKLLLDTHTLIWLFDGSNKLSELAKGEIENRENHLFTSVVSFWEIAIKISIGKLEMDLSMEDLQKLDWINGIEILPVRVEHTFLLRTLPFHHKDPFDRLLFSQAKSEGIKLLSGDEMFDPYFNENGVEKIW